MIAALRLIPVDLAICAAMFLLGCLVIRSLVGGTDTLAYLSLGLGVGGGLLSLGMFLLSWAGVPLVGTSIVGLYAGLLVLAAASAFRRRPASSGSPGVGDPGPSAWLAWLPSAVWLAICLLAAGGSVLAVGLSYFAWDDIATWSVGGYGIAQEGSIFAAGHWGNAGLLYPLNTQLQIAIFRILDGDLLPGSKLLFPAFYLSLLLGCYRFLTRQGIAKCEASAGTLVLATVPVIATHATMGYNNLQFSLYLVLGVLWILEGMQTRSARLQALGALLLGLSVWTRPEGLPMAVAAIVGVWAADLAAKGKAMRPIALAVPSLVLWVPWVVFRALHPVGTVEAYRDIPLALEGLLSGDVRWGALWTILRFVGGQVLRYRDWGVTLLLVGILLLWRLRPRHLRTDVAKAGLLMTSGALGGVVLFAHFMVAYAGKGEDFVYEWLALEFTRVFMPVGIALVLLAILCTFGRNKESAFSPEGPKGERPVHRSKQGPEGFSPVAQ